MADARSGEPAWSLEREIVGRGRALRRARRDRRRREHGSAHDGANDIVDGRTTLVRHGSSVHEGTREQPWTFHPPTTIGSLRFDSFSGLDSQATKGSTFAWSPFTQAAAAPQPPAHVGACAQPLQYAGNVAL